MSVIENLRKEIDKCDREIVNLLKKRQALAKEIGSFKKSNNILIYDAEREKEIMKDMKNLADENLNKDMIEAIFEDILLASKVLQNDL